MQCGTNYGQNFVNRCPNQAEWINRAGTVLRCTACVAAIPAHPANDIFEELNSARLHAVIEQMGDFHDYQHGAAFGASASEEKRAMSTQTPKPVDVNLRGSASVVDEPAHSATCPSPCPACEYPGWEEDEAYERTRQQVLAEDAQRERVTRPLPEGE